VRGLVPTKLWVPAALLAGTLLFGCGRKPDARLDAGAPASALRLHLPCVISGPMLKVVATYEGTHPEAHIETETDKPLAMLGTVREKGEPGVVITMGEVEMESLAASGANVSPVFRTC